MTFTSSSFGQDRIIVVYFEGRASPPPLERSFVTERPSFAPHPLVPD